MLVVSGKLSLHGEFTFNGLILAVGRGEIEVDGSAWKLTGGILVAGISEAGGLSKWDLARLSLRGDTGLVFDRGALRMAVSLIPPEQTGFREVTSSLDP